MLKKWIHDAKTVYILSFKHSKNLLVFVSLVHFYS